MLQTDIELTKKDGTVIKLSEYGFIVNDIVIDSMQINTKYQDKEKMNGLISMGSNYISRDIVVPCFVKLKIVQTLLICEICCIR